MPPLHHLAVVTALCATLISGCSPAGDAVQPSTGPSSSVSSSKVQGNDAEPIGNSFAERRQRDLLRCLREAGWEAKYDGANNTIFLGKVPPEQQERRSADEQRCSSEADAKNPARVLTDADYKDLYRQELKAMKCLEAAGFPPSQQPISEQQYVSEYKAQGPSWQAYRAVDSVSAEVFAELERKCPQPLADQ